jgi:ubiquitin C-terminal hydrolase
MEFINKFNNNVGLINFGNTCFMNASLQLLFCATKLGSFVTNINNIDSNSDLFKYIQTWKDYMAPETKTLGPRMIYSRYMFLNKNYLGLTQEDSHEFLTFTLDDLLVELKKLNIDEVLNKINKIYSIKFTQSVFYKTNNNTSNTEIYENILSLPINDESVSLENCYNLYKHQEEEDFTIDYNIIEFPKYIFVSLKRFKILSENQSIKINTEIEIPFETNMFSNIYNYRLKGFIIHSGNINGGHYYAYGCRKIDGTTRWFCYNDITVSDASLEQVHNESKIAYIYLYSKY